ncbi:MAG: hypothetical protein JST65_07410, partial [Acidobacteria bacterium]|nr:hypothetical protein [Acidobacteriota bacterium]
MDQDKADSLLRDFQSQSNLYTRFAESLKHDVLRLLEQNHLTASGIDCRVKTNHGLERKIRHKTDKTYTALRDITDIVGLRIVTYY